MKSLAIIYLISLFFIGCNRKVTTPVDGCSGSFFNCPDEDIVSTDNSNIATETANTIISSGYKHTCLIKKGELFCFGENGNGELGTGNMENRKAPAKVGANNNWIDVSAGHNHSCAVNSNRELFCFGSNYAGQMGTGDSEGNMSPEKIKGDQKWKSVSCGYYYSCALSAENRIYCFGSGSSGQLGDDVDSSENRLTPVYNPDSPDFIKIQATAFVTFGIDGNGALSYTGNNGSAYEKTTTFTSMAKDYKIKMIDYNMDVTYRHGCAVTDLGKLLCWGGNSSGQLGSGNTNGTTTPKIIGTDSDWQSFSAGLQFSCAIKTSGELYCYGDNSSSQTAPGSDETVILSPRKVNEDNDWQSVSAGSSHVCAAKQDGSIYCFGNNGSGQTGTDSSKNIVSTPTLLVF